jgi:hypothetical protein
MTVRTGVACDFVAQRSVPSATVPLALEWPGMAGAAFLMPGLVNGYGKIEQSRRHLAERMGAIEGALR